MINVPLFYNNPCATRVRKGPQYPFLHSLGNKATKLGSPLDETQRDPVSQKVWHNKDPSLLKDHKHQAKAYILQLFTNNGYVSIWLKYFQAEYERI